MQNANGELIDEDFAEVDPTGRFGRYPELLGKGSTKKVYRAFDKLEGREVAWNQVCLRGFLDNDAMIKGLYREVQLLDNLSCKNIVRLFGQWTDYEHRILNFITEVCTSGNLREYRSKHRRVSTAAIKSWSRQILKGLECLHNHEPCIVHRDLNCSNIFINGGTGEVKIGDFGLARPVGKDHMVHAAVGTPEFMAPEVFEEKYTEAVDIYAFGMCLLELVTSEIPYLECDSIVKIYQKVSSGVKPKALHKVENPEVKALTEKCLAHQSERPSASELLKDPFFSELDVIEVCDRIALL